MPGKIQIQINSAFSREELKALRDEIRNVEGFEAFDLMLPPEPVHSGTMSMEEAGIIGAIIGGVIHFGGEQIIETVHHTICTLVKKYLLKHNAAGLSDAKTMGINTRGGVVSVETDTPGNSKKTVTAIDNEGNEDDLSNREYSMDPNQTYAVLIGIGKYDDEKNFKEIEPVAGNMADMVATLTNMSLMGIPKKNIHPLENETSINIIKKLTEVSRKPGIETLLIYYTGHGVDSGDNKLKLIAKETHNIDEKLHGAIAFEVIENLVKTSPAKQKIIILDACHSGIAALGNSKDDFEFEPVYGTYLIASTNADEAAYFSSGKSHTYFTGHLLKLLNEGLKNTNTMLSLKDIFNYTTEKLTSGDTVLPGPTQKYNIKNVAEDKFFISCNPGFDLSALLKRPYNLLEDDKDEEAEIEHYRLVQLYSKERYPEKEGWDKEYLDLKKEKLHNKLAFEGDMFLAKGKFADAKNKYTQAKKISDTKYINVKIADCNKKITQAHRIETETVSVISDQQTTKDVTPEIPVAVPGKEKKVDIADPPVTGKKSAIWDKIKKIIAAKQFKAVFISIVASIAIFLIKPYVSEYFVNHESPTANTPPKTDTHDSSDVKTTIPSTTITKVQAQNLVDRLPQKLRSSEGLPDEDQLTFDSLRLIVKLYPDFKATIVNLYFAKANKLRDNNLIKDGETFRAAGDTLNAINTLIPVSKVKG